MANQVISNGTFTLATGTIRSVGTVATTINLVGTNYVATVQNITASAYQALDTSSLSDIRAGYFANNDISASIIIAWDNAGSKQVMILQPDDSVSWTFSGSAAANPMWAKSVSPADGKQAALEYILTES